VKSLIIVKQSGVGNYEWLCLGGDGPVVTVGDMELLAEHSQDSEQCIFITPTEHVSFRMVAFEASERKLLGQTLPYSLEDELIEDVDNLHFSMGSPRNESIPVAIARRDLIEKWLLPFQKEEVDVQQMIAELFFVPIRENCWSLLVDGHTCLIRFGLYQGFTATIDTASLALQLLLDQSEQFPDKLFIYGAAESQDQILATLPEMVRGLVEWKSDDYWSIVEQSLIGENTIPKESPEHLLSSTRLTDFDAVNFLQGQFARSLPWKKWWKTWRIPSVLLLAAVLLNISSAYTRVSALEETNIDLRREIEKTYRSVLPKGAVMDAEKQLRRKVAGLKGQGAESFVQLFAKVGSVIGKSKELTLQNLNYAGKQSEIRVTVMAKKFEDVEKVRGKLEKLGLSAELTGSSTEGNRTRARLKIRG